MAVEVMQMVHDELISMGLSLRGRTWVRRTSGSATVEHLRWKILARRASIERGLELARAVFVPGQCAGCGSGWRAGRSGGCARSLWAAHGGRSGAGTRWPQRHAALLAAMGIVLPAEGDALAVEAEQAVVGDGDAMGIAAEIAQHLRRAAQGLLGIDHPVLAMHGA